MNSDFQILSDKSGSVMVPEATMSDKGHSVNVAPFVMPRAQEYYWTSTWQKAERAARADIEAGRFAEFSGEDVSEVIRWLEAD